MKLLLALFLGFGLGIAAMLVVEAAERAMSDHVGYTRACLPGDQCTMRIVPKDAPWLALTCELTEPPRCRDE